MGRRAGGWEGKWGGRRADGRVSGEAGGQEGEWGGRRAGG